MLETEQRDDTSASSCMHINIPGGRQRQKQQQRRKQQWCVVIKETGADVSHRLANQGVALQRHDAALVVVVVVVSSAVTHSHTPARGGNLV